jgi:hypothetical protein
MKQSVGKVLDEEQRDMAFKRQLPLVADAFHRADLVEPNREDYNMAPPDAQEFDANFINDELGVLKGHNYVPGQNDELNRDVIPYHQDTNRRMQDYFNNLKKLGRGHDMFIGNETVRQF